jgi:hypothetical protein
MPRYDGLDGHWGDNPTLSVQVHVHVEVDDNVDDNDYDNDYDKVHIASSTPPSPFLR